MTRPMPQSFTRDPLVQGLLAVLFLAVAAVLSLPAARGAGPIGAMPLWLLLLPATGLFAAVVLRWPAAPSPEPAATARRRRPVVAPRRGGRGARRGSLSRAA